MTKVGWKMRLWCEWCKHHISTPKGTKFFDAVQRKCDKCKLISNQRVRIMRARSAATLWKPWTWNRKEWVTWTSEFMDKGK